MDDDTEIPEDALKDALETVNTSRLFFGLVPLKPGQWSADEVVREAEWIRRDEDADVLQGI
jgi:hypothetical protein